jgi:hypothetical protein
MKALLPILVLLTLAACQQGKDFSKIKTGMTTSAVIRLTGIPDRKQVMVGSEWWIYDDSAKHLVIISSDTVVNITTQAEAMKTMEKTLKAFDSLRNAGK